MNFFFSIKNLAILVMLAVALSTTGCADHSFEKYKELYDARAFLFGNKSGIIITYEKDIPHHNNCDFNYADLTASIIRNKLTSEGIASDTIKPVSSPVGIINEWKQQGKVHVYGKEPSFDIYELSLHYRKLKDDIEKKTYVIYHGIYSRHFLKHFPFNYTPGPNPSSETCYAEFEKSMQQVVDAFYQEMIAQTPKENL